VAKKTNDAPSGTVRITLSKQSVELLNRLAARGVHGRNAAEVAARMVDRALEQYVDMPKLQLIEEDGNDN
jgi:hypothetical protein